MSITAGFQRALRELEEGAAQEVSEGFNTGPLGESPVQDRVVVGPEEKKRGWVGSRGVKLSARRSEMKQIKEFFLVNMCHAQLLSWSLPALLQALGLNTGQRNQKGGQSKTGGRQRFCGVV